MRLLTDDEKADTIVPLLELLHADSSWKIRQHFAKICPNVSASPPPPSCNCYCLGSQLCRCAGDRIASAKVLPLFVNSLMVPRPARLGSARHRAQDGELSVRLAATCALEEVAGLTKEGALQHVRLPGATVWHALPQLTPVLESLSLDPSEKVRGR